MRILDGAFLDALETLDINVQQMKSGHYSGARRSRAYGSSPEFADYREYVPGDDLRRIDWNAAARFDKYLIKRFIDEKQGRNCVYLDTSASMGFEPEKGFAALRMAAALGYLSVCNMDSVSFRLLSGTRCTELCPRISGRESFLRAGEKLDALEYALRKERTTVQKQMDEALRQLYEAKVPEAVRDYLDNKNKPTPPKRPPRHTKAADSVEKKRDLEVQEDGDNRDGPVRERQ